MPHRLVSRSRSAKLKPLRGKRKKIPTAREVASIPFPGPGPDGAIDPFDALQEVHDKGTDIQYLTLQALKFHLEYLRDGTSTEKSQAVLELALYVNKKAIREMTCVLSKAAENLQLKTAALNAQTETVNAQTETLNAKTEREKARTRKAVILARLREKRKSKKKEMKQMGRRWKVKKESRERTSRRMTKTRKTSRHRPSTQTQSPKIHSRSQTRTSPLPIPQIASPPRAPTTTLEDISAEQSQDDMDNLPDGMVFSKEGLEEDYTAS